LRATGPRRRAAPQAAIRTRGPSRPRRATPNSSRSASRTPCMDCTTIRHFLRAPRRIVGQVFNLRRIVNPPAALVRARHGLGESPTPFGACRYAGQDGILRATQRVPLPSCPTVLAGFQVPGKTKWHWARVPAPRHHTQTPVSNAP
jgi:hypothetical protein